MANGKKSITIDLDPKTGKILAKDPPGQSVREIPMADVTLAVKSGNAVVHHKVVYVPENTVIHTQTNPTCTWIFIGGRWIQICT